MSQPRKLLHCHCVYAKVVPKDVKEEVLRRLNGSGEPFEAVPDLCEMSARKDPALGRLVAEENLEIVACFPRALRWLFHAAGHELPEATPVHNMREATADAIVDALALAPSEEAPR